MTENIRTNGYSKANGASDIWVLKTDYNALMSLFMKRVLMPILTITAGTPTSMSVNTIISNDLSDRGFMFNDRFPLEPGTTTFNVNIGYHLKNLNTGNESDTVTKTRFYVVRKAGAVLTPDIESICWDKGELSLYYKTQPVVFVDETMQKLEVRFDPGTTDYQSVIVEVTATGGLSRDLENIKLLFNSAYWSEDFARSIADAIRGDSALQHKILDSIIVTYRNPKLPLDTARISVPFSISKTISFPAATYNDRDADGFIDSIFIGVSGVFSKEEDMARLAALITLPPERNFKIDSVYATSGGLVYIVTENSSVPQTYVTKTDIIGVKQGLLPAGGMVVGGTITVQDKISPVIVSAQLIAGSSDSVKVTFSEPVAPFTSSEPFLFRKPGGAEYEVLLDPNGTLSGDHYTYTARVRQVQNDSYISSSDSTWINPAANIADTAGNIQLDPHNRRVELSVKQVPYTVIPKVINNPLSPNTPVPANVIDAYAEAGKKLPPDNTGMVIVVEPKDGKVRPGIKLSGTASVFDVVKNIIIEDIPMVEKDGVLFLVWDGRNSKGRKVSTGTYVAVMKITDNQNPPYKENKSIRIGVKR